jgi:cytochrome c-type biogenesis protein CcmE
MTQLSWEKSPTVSPAPKTGMRFNGRAKFLIGGVLILVAVMYLIVSGTQAGSRFFITVDDLTQNRQYTGQSVRITGAVLGDTIRYDEENLIIEFTIANIPSEYEDLAETLHLAVTNPDATRMQVRVEGQVRPDTLRHEAQAILTGTLGDDGVFRATELMFKCPTRFEEAHPGQSIVNPSA